MDTSNANIKNSEQPVVAYGKEILGDFVTRVHELDLLHSKKQSSFKDTVFNNNIGDVASSIMLLTSKLQLLGTNDNYNFYKNQTP